MLAGLIVGVVFGVVVVGVLAPLSIRWYVQRNSKRTTKIYILPPPVQTRSMTWPAGWPNLQSPSVAYEQMVPKARPLSNSAPVATDYVPSPNSSVSTMVPRIRSHLDLTPIPVGFTSMPTTPNSMTGSFQITPKTATSTVSPLDDLTPRSDTGDTIPALAYVASRIPSMKKAQTFQSVAAISRYPSSAESDSTSVFRSPKTPERANTMHSTISSRGSLRSTYSGYATLDQPTFHTAAMYSFSSEDLPSWNRASTVHLDEGLPPVPGTFLVPTAYVPYRPPVG